MMPISYYCRPDELWSLGGAVADTVGTTDSDYTNEWLCDARYGRPAKASGGSITWTITNPAGTVNFVALAHHTVNGGRSITIGGTIAASLVAPTDRPHRIPRNPFASIAGSSSVTTLSVSIMGNTSPVVCKVFAGALRAVPRAGFLAEQLTDTPVGRDYTPSFIQRYDDGYSAPRVFKGVLRCNDAQADDLMAWSEAQLNGSRPSVFIPNIAVQDTRVVHLDPPVLTRNGLLWRAALTLREYPQARW